MRLTPVDCARGFAVALIWGNGVVFTKAALGEFPPILLMAFRFTIAALVLVWLVRPPAGQMLRLFGISVLAGAVQYSLTFTGLKGLDASVTAFVLQLEVPLLVIVGAVALKERPGFRKCAGIAMAFGGVALMAGEPRVAGAWVSLLLVLGGAVSWAVCQAAVRSLRLDGRTVTTWIAVFTAPQLFLLSTLIEGDPLPAIRSAGPEVWWVAAYLGLVMTCVADTTWNSLVRRHPISAVAPFLLMQPVFSALGAMLLLGERLGPPILVGAAVIIGGVAFILFDRRRPVAETEAEPVKL
jgi:O-acetylserine/cysteine efflux transporter